MENNMGFDMEKCGALISRLRKQAGYTQAGLAQRLGISYQAVSSWERGASMPDIGKLRDLANALNTTVDHILSGDAESIPAPRAAMPAFETPAPESKEEESAAEPAAAPEQANEEKPEHATEEETKQESRKTGSDLASLLKLAPFMDQQTLDKAALEMDPASDMKALVALAPFVSSKVLGEIVRVNEGALPTHTLAALAPFLDGDVLEEIAAKSEDEGDERRMIALAPFMAGKSAGRLFDRLKEKLSDIRRMFGEEKPAYESGE
ncbi:MAG: helix-turn-helix domain-containing protein, partial [Clostridia bacterium]|nr:helix-turn-helix domain-containing protein [Clostridia bacterium]